MVDEPLPFGHRRTAPWQALVSARRLRRLLGFATLQVLVQGAGFAAGIVVVRSLSPQQYGPYTLVVSAIALGGVLLDLGLANAVLALGGPCLRDPAAMAALMREAGRLQGRLAALLALPLLALFVAMLQAPGVLPPAVLAGTALAALATVALNASNTRWSAWLRLRGEVAALQRLDGGANLARALGLALLSLWWLDAAWATAALLAGAALVHRGLRRWRHELLAVAPQADGQRAALRRLVVRQAPNTLYYCVASQLPLWLLGWVGGTERVAEAGALGRLALLLNLVLAAVSSLLQPYMARTADARELAAGLAAVNGCFVVLGGALLALAAALPAPLLWILGPHYQGLDGELPWLVGSAVLAAWSGAVYSLGAARGWLVPAPWVIGGGVAATVAGVALLDLSTVRGMLVLNTATAALSTVLALVFVGRALRRHGAGEGRP